MGGRRGEEHLLLDPLRVLRVLGQQEEGPGEHRGRGLMARDQQRHQVVTQLLGRDVVAWEQARSSAINLPTFSLSSGEPITSAGGQDAQSGRGLTHRRQ